jgi:hypothetical protein
LVLFKCKGLLNTLVSCIQDGRWKKEIKLNPSLFSIFQLQGPYQFAQIVLASCHAIVASSHAWFKLYWWDLHGLREEKNKIKSK